MNKKAEQKMSIWAIVAVAAIVILGVMYFGNQGTNTGTGSGGNPIVISSDQCELSPVITVTANDALQPGSTYGVTSYARVNGQYVGSITSGTSTFKKGDSVELLLSNATDVIDVTYPAFTVDCGNNIKTFNVYRNSTPTVSIYNDADTAVLTDAATGGAQNESNSSSGGSKTWKVSITGQDKRSSSDMIYVVELGTDTTVDSVTLSDNNGNAMTKLAAVPSGLTVSGTNNHRVAFEVPAINGAVKKEYFLTAQAKAGQLLTGSVYTTFYEKQAFVDNDGTFKTGVVDSQGNTKYQYTFDYDFTFA